MQYRKKIIDELLPTDYYGCHFRLVKIEDANFILSMRNQEKLSRYISWTSVEIESQIKWLKEYKVREKRGEDFYLICLKGDKETKLGVNRIYNISDDDFEIGSWVFSPDAGPNMAILGDLFTRSIAFEKLHFKTCRIAVRKKNRTVLKYTRSFNPTLVSEDELSYFFELNYDAFKVQKDKYLKILSFD